MKRILLAGMAVACAMSAGADTYTIKWGMRDKVVDLTDPNSYEEGVAPTTGAGNVLALKTGWESGIGYLATTINSSDAASMALFTNFDNISLPYGTRLTLNCATDVTLTKPVTGNGTLVKKGVGTTLRLTSHTLGSKNTYDDYYVSWDVQEGTLRMPESTDATIRSHTHRDIYVAEGATLVVASNATTSASTLNGFGMVTNEVPIRDEQGAAVYNQFILDRSGGVSMFGGIVGGPIMFKPSGGTLTLTNELNTFTQGAQIHNGGVLEVTKFPDANNLAVPSPLGNPLSASMTSTSTGGGTLRYIGDTDAVANYGMSMASTPFTFDAGHHGGVTLSGTIAMYSSTLTLSKLYLTGSNTVPCEMYAPILTRDLDDYLRSIYITKQGTGTYRFHDLTSAGKSASVYAPHGVIAVENGTLEYDTLAEKGTYCALGYADGCYKKEADTPSEEAKVDYAFRLGGSDANGAATEGRLIYTGTSLASCTSRVAVVDTYGTLGSSNAWMHWTGIDASGSGNKTLGVYANTDQLVDFRDIVNSGATLSLVKSGNGTCRVLGSDGAVNGSVSVLGGRLIVENHAANEPYKWFRLWIKETAATCARTPDNNCANKVLELSEFAVFDETGVRQNIGMTVVTNDFYEANNDYYYVQQCECTMQNSSILNAYKDASCNCLFDNIKQTPANNWCGGMRFEAAKQARLDDASTWIPITFRLSDSAPEVVSCDMVTSEAITNAAGEVDSSGYRLVTAFGLDGSADGIKWEQVYVNDAVPVCWPASTWSCNGNSWWTGYSTSRPSLSGKSYAFTKAAKCATNTRLAIALTSLKVAAGASVEFAGVKPEIAAMEVAASGMGGVKNVKFAASGEVNFTGLGKGEQEIAAAFTDVTDLANVGDWTMLVDGVQTAKKQFSVSATGFVVRPLGLCISIR